MKVSVIIPTWNRAETIRETIFRLKRQRVKNVEILVIDDGSDGDNLRIIKGIKGVRVYYQRHKGPAAARNLAINRAKGKVLIFINDDTWTKQNFILRHREFHEKNRQTNLALLGPLKEDPSFKKDPAVEWLIKESRQHFSYKLANQKSVPWYYFWTCNISVKKDFLIKNNLFFDESFPSAAWEDIEFAYRAEKAGLKLSFDKNLMAFHHHQFGFDDVLARFYNHGRGLYHLEKKLPDNFLPPLAKKRIREALRIVLRLIGYNYWDKRLIAWLKTREKLPNNLMQLVVLAKKIEGFENERKILR